MARIVDTFLWNQRLDTTTDPESTENVAADVYALIHPDDGVIYVGSTRTTMRERDATHKRSFAEHIRNSGCKSTPLTGFLTATECIKLLHVTLRLLAQTEIQLVCRRTALGVVHGYRQVERRQPFCPVSQCESDDDEPSGMYS